MCIRDTTTGCNIVVTPLNSILSSISPYCKWLDHSERRTMYCTDYHILYPYPISHCPPASPKPHYTNVSLISCPPLNQHPVLHLDAVCATIRYISKIPLHSISIRKLIEKKNFSPEFLPDVDTLGDWLLA